MSVTINKKRPCIYATLDMALKLRFSYDHAAKVRTALSILSEDRKREVVTKMLMDFRESEGKQVLALKNTSKLSVYKHQPVSPEIFLLDPYYMNMQGQVYPEILKEFIEINSGNYMEIVLTGGIGTAKTTLAVWSTAYQLYLLSLMKNPQNSYGLDRTSEILFVFQSLSAKKAKDLDYARFRALIEGSQYFKEEFPFNTDLESELKFPNRIIVRPISGDPTASIGENVFGGIIDEINFMSVVENSKQSIDGGTYDQAVALYNSIARRRKSRFMQAGVTAGLLCLVSSKRYPGQFTDIKEEEARRNKTIYVYDKRIWDIKPEGTFSGNWFDVFIGDIGRQPRVISADENYDMEDRHLIVAVPEEYREEFESDMTNALRDIAGVSTLATIPFITDTKSISACMGKVPSILRDNYTDFITSKVGILKSKFSNPHLPRSVHLDLSKTGDSTGVAIGHCPGFQQILRGDEVENLPLIVIDCTLEVKPPKHGEILYYKIRTLLYKLRELGLNIKWVTADTYQSTDMLQILKQKGFTTGALSMDTSIMPYELLKSALYDNRIALPEDKHLQLELASLELDPKKDKVDHPPNGSKDVADAVAGVTSCLSTRREIYGMFGIPLVQAPAALMGDLRKDSLTTAEPEKEFLPVGD
ncbi:MAG: hypothetical protein OEX12_14635 [Gammaproteobacteria bacterium]|nr:hypothetical protein [Gammaproteobacteria bacterium]